jgi:hypothetical protein
MSQLKESLMHKKNMNLKHLTLTALGYVLEKSHWVDEEKMPSKYFGKAACFNDTPSDCNCHD